MAISKFSILASCIAVLSCNAFTFVPRSSDRHYSNHPNIHNNSPQQLQVLHMSDTDTLDLSSVSVMVNGMPGPMATAAAEACLRKGLKLAPVAMTGPNVEPMTITVVDPDTSRHASVRLIPSSNTDEVQAAIVDGLKTAVGENNLVAIDYTHPSAVNSNGRWYADSGIPFVMGTTGGDREQLLEDVSSANSISAVIAPNMGKQIVAMQAALEYLAKTYPNAFDGYDLEVTESHQKTKADTSGTAKAVIADLKTLSGDDFDVETDVQMLRSDEESLAFGVKEDALKGHAFHTYTLTSSDGSVQFALQHNVSGRRVYAEGTADAVNFLAKKIRTDPPQIYSMVNVLEEGALE